jgi:hypothetical protein
MAVNERELEENEAKIDNILHKVLISLGHIRDLTESLDTMSYDKTPEEERDFIMQRTKKIILLVETVTNLTLLADEIDVQDEKITWEMDKKITGELDVAINKILDARKLLETEKNSE